MQLTTRLVLVLLGPLLFSAAIAQDTTDDEADVLLAIEREWEAARKGDQDLVDDMLTQDFMGWSKNSPAPRSKSSNSQWRRFNEQMGSVVRYELYPLSITVHGDVAVAHYLYSTAFKKKGGEIEMANGRYTDVLVRTENGWKFLAWHGGDDD
ncbi:MAG: nuclear transport factor 2 family protein [Woeseiaceae bacterium]